jgi:predicted ATPase/class 3 adenylate cyclase
MSSGRPTGLVTFVLTDIEGSTRIFRQLGDGWPAVLEHHDELLRDAFGRHGGVVFKSEGDALLLAFDSAAAATRAAVEAQRRLADERWPHGVRIRVRMGLHTGIAFAREDDYVALALHQAARIVGVASGGQVVASKEAVAAAGELNGVRIEPLGRFRVRDFDEPAELFQLSDRDAPSPSFPPLRAVRADGHNLEPPGDVLIGRDDELAVLADLAAAGRVLTICGPGGIGKTRLAIEVGLRVADRWDGVWMVDLAVVPPGQPVDMAVSSALGASADGDDVFDAITDRLRDRPSLLILDNCEHVLASVRDVVRRVLSACPTVGIVATSRERLDVRAEQVYVLQPLAGDDDAVSLFIDRARHRDGFLVFDDADRAVIAEICDHLDHLPLAIELAAARSNVLSPHEMLDSLRVGRSVEGPHQYVAERQQTLRRLLDWSYERLDATEQLVFRSLAAFAGSFDLRTAAVAVGDEHLAEGDVAEVVWRLVDKSLVQNERRDGATRYRLLETVRTAAHEYAGQVGESGAIRRRLASHYLATFPIDTRGNREWRARLALERATIRHLVDELVIDGELEAACGLIRISVEQPLTGGSPAEGVRELNDFMNRVADTNGLARLHATLAKEYAARNEPEAARGHLSTARDLIARFGDHDVLGDVTVVGAEAMLILRSGSVDTMREAQLALRAELANTSSASMRADLLLDLSLISGDLGDDAVLAELEEAADIADRLDDHTLRMFVLNNLAEQKLRAGDVRGAAAHQSEAMRLSAALGMPTITAFGLVLAARIAQPRQLDATAVRLHAAADVLLAEAGYELLPEDRHLSDAMLSAARRNLGDRYEAEYEAGGALSLIDAVTLAETVLAGPV